MGFLYHPVTHQKAQPNSVPYNCGLHGSPLVYKPGAAHVATYYRPTGPYSTHLKATRGRERSSPHGHSTTGASLSPGPTDPRRNQILVEPNLCAGAAPWRGLSLPRRSPAVTKPRAPPGPPSFLAATPCRGSVRGAGLPLRPPLASLLARHRPRPTPPSATATSGGPAMPSPARGEADSASSATRRFFQKVRHAYRALRWSISSWNPLPDRAVRANQVGTGSIRLIA